MSIDAGMFLGPYELVDLIGSGGMGQVYRARDSRLRRDVALKVLRAPDERAVARFKTEARAVAAITHPNIMAVHDYGEHEGTAYIVYELLEGETLRQRIVRGALPWRQAVEIAADIATGLAAAHAKGIVHGDVKPENVFITSDGRVTLVDFGLARLAAASDTADHATEPLDGPGGITGTLAYMAPEMLGGEAPSAASDIFALGCVLYEMIAGRAAFLSDSPVSTLNRILNTDPVPIAGRTMEVPEEIEALVRRCLSKQPSNRFVSARDLALTLRTLVATTSSRSQAIVAASPERPIRWSRIAAAVGVAILFAVPWVLTHRTNAPIAIAVLPFENATADADSEYAADGLTENLINALSQVPALSVRARASVFRLKGQPAERAAHDLGADVVVTGRIRRRGGSIVVSAELVNPAEKRQLWGQVYERRPDQLLGIQEEIAREVIAALRVNVSEPVRERISARMPSNNEAYELYLRGRFHLNQRTEESFLKAISFFARAIERDPTFALGYSGLADCYVLLNGYGLRKPAEVVPKALAAATRALELDPSLAEAHATLGAIEANHHFDWRAAEGEYRKAIALNASYATARQWYGGFLTGIGRFDDAMTQLESAQQLDPLSLVVPVQIGLRYYFDRRYDDAIREYQRVFELSPNLPTAHEYTALAYDAKGMYPQAVASYLRYEELRGTPAADVAGARRAFASGGMTAFRKWQLARLVAQRRTQYVSPIELAMLYGQTGEPDKAFAELSTAMEQHASGLIWLKLEPRFDPLRGDPRFKEVLAKMNLR
jgi:eukaryotic-like serine/threonine-protein kinase